jgi:hypothetical protein
MHKHALPPPLTKIDRPLVDWRRSNHMAVPDPDLNWLKTTYPNLFTGLNNGRVSNSGAAVSTNRPNVARPNVARPSSFTLGHDNSDDNDLAASQVS